MVTGDPPCNVVLQNVVSDGSIKENDAWLQQIGIYWDLITSSSGRRGFDAAKAAIESRL